MESNDRPEVPDRGETLDIPGLPSEFRVISHSGGRYSVHSLSTLSSNSVNSHSRITGWHIQWVNTHE